MTIVTAAMRARSRTRNIRDNYPHQVAFWHSFCTMENFEVIKEFCLEHYGKFPVSYRLPFKWNEGDRDTEDAIIYCFATAEQADEFRRHFEGEPFDLSACHRTARGTMLWLRSGPPHSPIRRGPLSVPKWIRGRP